MLPRGSVVLIPAELRRINMVPAASMPMTNGFGIRSTAVHSRDPGSGARRRRRDRLCHAPRRQREPRAAARARPRLPHQRYWRLAERERRYPLRGGRHGVADHRDTDHRQGHETTFPQILADRLGIPNDMIRLVQGDTDQARLDDASGLRQRPPRQRRPGRCASLGLRARPLATQETEGSNQPRTLVSTG